MLDRNQNRASATVRASTIVIPKDREIAGDIAGLVESIRTFGVLQPIGVRRAHGDRVLVWGGKRHRAVLTIDPNAEIEIIDLGEITDDEAAVAEIEENLRRHQYTQEERAAQTARSVELRTKVITARVEAAKRQAELSGQSVPKPNGRPPERRTEAVRAEAAAQSVSAKTIERQLKSVGVGVETSDRKKAKPQAPTAAPRAHGKVTKGSVTTWDALKAAYDGATKATQRKLFEYAAREMDAAEWSKFVAELPRKDIPREAIQ